QAVRRLREVAERAGVRRYAVQPPGRATGLIAPRRALELWLEGAAPDGDEAEVTVIESAGGQKEMAEALRARRERARGATRAPAGGGGRDLEASAASRAGARAAERASEQQRVFGIIAPNGPARAGGRGLSDDAELRLDRARGDRHRRCHRGAERL